MQNEPCSRFVQSDRLVRTPLSGRPEGPCYGRRRPARNPLGRLLATTVHPPDTRDRPDREAHRLLGEIMARIRIGPPAEGHGERPWANAGWMGAALAESAPWAAPAGDELLVLLAADAGWH